MSRWIDGDNDRQRDPGLRCNSAAVGSPQIYPPTISARRKPLGLPATMAREASPLNNHRYQSPCPNPGLIRDASALAPLRLGPDGGQKRPSGTSPAVCSTILRQAADNGLFAAPRKNSRILNVLALAVDGRSPRLTLASRSIIAINLEAGQIGRGPFGRRTVGPIPRSPYLPIKSNHPLNRGIAGSLSGG
jgi:hypothetical protein